MVSFFCKEYVKCRKVKISKWNSICVAYWRWLNCCPKKINDIIVTEFLPIWHFAQLLCLNHWCSIWFNEVAVFQISLQMSFAPSMSGNVCLLLLPWKTKWKLECWVVNKTLQFDMQPIGASWISLNLDWELLLHLLAISKSVIFWVKLCLWML